MRYFEVDSEVKAYALGIALYGFISTILLTLVARPNSVTLLAVIVSTLLFSVLIYLNISLSEDRERYRGYDWTMTFVIGEVMGLLACWIVQAVYWNTVLGVTIWAGIYAFSHLVITDVKEIKDQLEVPTENSWKARQVYAEWLKLEHNHAQTVFQVYISLIGLVITGGIVLYYLEQKISFWSTSMQGTLVITIWGIIGLWFLILSPLQDKMYHLRKKIREMATSPISEGERA